MENMLQKCQEKNKFNKVRSQTYKQVVANPADRGLTLFRLEIWNSKYCI